MRDVPDLDNEQNLVFVAGSEINGVTTIEWARVLTTSDAAQGQCHLCVCVSQAREDEEEG